MEKKGKGWSQMRQMAGNRSEWQKWTELMLDAERELEQEKEEDE